MPEAIFERRGDLFQPTQAAVGPWDPGALHGGPVAMLLARGIEAQAPDGEMDIVRLTVELLRPVPVAPLAVRTAVERPGKRVQLAGAVITAEGVEVALARALRIRRKDLQVDTEPAPPPSQPEQIAPWKPPWGDVEAYGSLGVELRWGAGEFGGLGPAAMWCRLRLPVVPGEEPSPLQRVAAAADFGNGISNVLDWTTHVFINPDLTINLQRPAEGEWVYLDSRTDVGPGYGVAHSVLFDRRGEVGRSLQSLFIEAR